MFFPLAAHAMKNSAFRFLDSDDSVARLISRLADVGLDHSTADGEDNLRFKCRWLHDTPITLHWQYNWWPNGFEQEDASVALIVDGEPVASVDITAMLNRQLDHPLREEITDQIVAMASSFTGKPA